MASIDFINDPNWILCCSWFFGLGLVSWFMGFGISSLISIFIKILKKA